MSTVRTTVETLADVRPHTNSDHLNLATVRGWQMVLKRDERKTGDHVVYFEAGTVLPRAWAEKFEVVNYLSEKTDIDGHKVLVVGKVRLRGEPSFGLTVPVEVLHEIVRNQNPGALVDTYFPVGTDVSHLFGTSKFRPPVRSTAGDAAVDHPHFPAYTDVENLRNFPEVLVEGEPVVVREKLHGTNCRVGFVVDPALGNELDGDAVRMAGSRELRRKRPNTPDEMAANTYWFPHTLAPVHNLLEALHTNGHKAAVLYGEVYGASVQKGFDYGHKRPHFRAFDLMIDGNYVDDARFTELCTTYGVETAPVLYTGPYSLEKVKELAAGPAVAGGSHIREGVVVTPATERTDPQVGRVILKYVSDAYLFLAEKPGMQDYTDQ
jgi:RNA ligase (TIGR02306 family)